MKNRYLKQTLVALAVGGLGMLASAAHAEHDGFGNSRAVSPGHFPERGFDERHGRSYERHDVRRGENLLDRIEARQHRQRARIIAGKRSGELTRYSFRDLMSEQRQINSMKSTFLADGHLDRREFYRLDRAQDRASQAIRAERQHYQARNHRDGHGPWYN